jgi:hypothetical protein
MSKKDYLSRVLAQLEPVWDLAKWLKMLVAEWNLWDNVLDMLINLVQWAINSAKNENEKAKLQKWLDFLQKMKQMERESRLQDERDLAKLERILENF